MHVGPERLLGLLGGPAQWMMADWVPFLLQLAAEESRACGADGSFVMPQGPWLMTAWALMEVGMSCLGRMWMPVALEGGCQGPVVAAGRQGAVLCCLNGAGQGYDDLPVFHCF